MFLISVFDVESIFPIKFQKNMFDLYLVGNM